MGVLLEAGGSVKQKPTVVIGAHTTGAGIHGGLLFVGGCGQSHEVRCTTLHFKNHNDA